MSSSETAERAISKPAEARRPKILVVDDQRDSARVVQLYLRAAGFDCSTCADGASAMAVLDREEVDLVLLDVMMPDCDGIEVCRWIKAHPRVSDIPVIFLTAHLKKDDRVRGLDVGGHDYLHKPVEPEELLARTRAALRVKQLQDELKGQLRLQRQLNLLMQERLTGHWESMLGQLAASLAHELNNPLAVAVGTAQLLALEPTLSEESADRVHTIDASLQRVGKRLRSLLLIAHPPNHQERVVLADLLDDLVALANYRSVLARVKVGARIESEAFWTGSPGLLARALLVLLNNGVEAASGKTDARVEIVLAKRKDGICVTVADNGPGIPEQARARLFEPFFTTKERPHAGVGLYLAREVMKSIGGELRLEPASSPGDTRFSIRLPVNAE